MKKHRKTIQLTSHDGNLYALCDDGSAWQWCIYTKKWIKTVQVPTT